MSTLQEKHIKMMKTSELEDRLVSIQKKYSKLGAEYCKISKELQDRRNNSTK